MQVKGGQVFLTFFLQFLYRSKLLKLEELKKKKGQTIKGFEVRTVAVIEDGVTRGAGYGDTGMFPS